MKIFCKKILRRIGIEVIKKLRKVNYICQGTKDRERERMRRGIRRGGSDRQGRGWSDRGGGSANSCLNMIGDKRSAKMATAQFDTCNEEERQYYGNLRLQVDESWLRLLLIFLKPTY